MYTFFLIVLISAAAIIISAAFTRLFTITSHPSDSAGITGLVKVNKFYFTFQNTYLPYGPADYTVLQLFHKRHKICLYHIIACAVDNMNNQYLIAPVAIQVLLIRAWAMAIGSCSEHYGCSAACSL